MTKSFAEQIIDSMVDENGHCGERGLSAKQFAVLAKYLDEGEWLPAGGWEGDYAWKTFYACDYTGTIGAYNVKLNWFAHFHDRYSVVSIDRRPAADLEREAHAEEMCDFEHSEWQGEVGKRSDIELTFVREYSYEVPGHGWNAGYEDRYIYTFADDDGNCYVWKTGNVMVYRPTDDDRDATAQPGDKVTLRATVKEHGEYRGVKQTVLTRCKVQAVEPFAA